MIKHPLQIGSILYTSWGYEQTNIDFYQVIELIGTSTVVLRELAQERIIERNDEFCGKTKAKPNCFIDEPFRKRANAQGRVRMSSFSHARLWDGDPLYYSSYH